MQSLPLSTLTDPARLSALRQAALLDAPPESSFGHLTGVAVKALHTPMSMVTFLDAEREIVESGTGLPEPWSRRRELPLDHSYCQYVVAYGEPLLIEDAREHELTRGSPAIEDLGAVAYAGIPIRLQSGPVLGAFCVMNRLPRAWEAEEVEVLTNLAQVVEREIDHRLVLRRQRRERAALEGKFAAELLEASRFRTLVENSLAGIYLLEGEHVLYANPRLRELFGYAPDEPLNRLRISDWVVEEDRARVLENIRKRTEGEAESIHYTFRGRRKDGSAIEVEALGSRVEMDGRPTIIGTLLDVTERRRAEEALRQTAERLQFVERATEDVIWDWETRTGEVRWNEWGSKMFRYRPEEVGSTIEWHQEHIHPEDRERVIRGLQQVLSGADEFWSDEYRFRRGDGQYATVLDRGFVVRSERGEPLRVIGSMMDVTERKREEERQRFLSRASALLDSSLDYEPVLAKLARLSVPVLGDYCMIDLVEEGGVRRVAATHADPMQEEALWEAGEAAAPGRYSRPVAEVVRTGASIFLPECDEGSLERLGYSAEERERLRALGLCSIIVVPLVTGERRLGAITVGTADSTRQYTPVDLMTVQDLAHRAALAIDHADLYHKATRAIRARDEVLGVVSHDLRNPLNAIQMCAAMLYDSGRERRSENQRWLDMITRTVDQMSALISNLLDVSSIEAGRFSVEPLDRSVGAVLRDACDLLKPLATEKGIRLESHVDDRLTTIRIDSPQILRVISNLVGNALKFTPAGGRVEMRAEGRGAEVLFSVSDTGPGIPAAQLPRVFDRYWKARPGDRRGAGLGLAIARGIVEAHGGRIWVESSEGEGATFFFTLPAREQAREG